MAPRDDAALDAPQPEPETAGAVTDRDGLGAQVLNAGPAGEWALGVEIANMILGAGLVGFDPVGVARRR